MHKIKMDRPKRIPIGERIHKIIAQEIMIEVMKYKFSHLQVAGRSTERIIKIIQNNYRRRVY